MQFSLSPMVFFSCNRVRFLMFILVLLNSHLNIIDSYLPILFRCPTSTQWADKKRSSTLGWWWMRNSLHNFIIGNTQSWAGRKCLCSILLITFIYFKLLYALELFFLHNFHCSVIAQYCFCSIFRYHLNWFFNALRWRKCWWWWPGGNCRFWQSHWLWWRWRPVQEKMSFLAQRNLKNSRSGGGRRTINF